jgi:hypothetical protein
MQEWWVNITGIYTEKVLTTVFFKKIIGDNPFTDARIKGLDQFFFGFNTMDTILDEY